MQAIVQSGGSTIYAVYPDSYSISIQDGLPRVTDDTGHQFVLGLAPDPALITGQTFPADAPLAALTFNGTAVVLDPAAYAKALSAAIAAKLQDLEIYGTAKAVGGTTVGGFAVGTDLTTRTDLNGAYLLAQANPQFTTQWFSGGAAVTLTAAQILQIAPAVGTFYSACYDNIAAHAKAISALTTLAAVVAYDFTTGWPKGT